MTDEIRRSGRKRKRSSKYSGEAWEDLLDIVGAPSEDEATRHLDEAVDSEEEFVVPEEPDQPSGREDDSADERHQKDASNGGAEQDNEGSDGGSDDGSSTRLSHSEESDDGSRMSRSKAGGSYRLDLDKLKGVGSGQRSTTSTAPEQHVRGIRLNVKMASRDKAVKRSFGKSPEDIVPLMKGREKWFDEITLPSRQENADGVGGLAHSFFVSDEAREIEATTGWDWYHEGAGRAAFRKHQVSRLLSIDKSQSYTSSSSLTQDFVMGPINQQKAYKLGSGQAFDINATLKPDAGDAQTSATGHIQNKRKGWVINVGGPAHCMDWVPNHPGLKQYLAISTYTRSPFSDDTNPSSTAPAFAVTDPSPATVKIWTITASNENESTTTIDTSQPPKLSLVLCLDWGHIKEFKWCPSFRQARSTDAKATESYLGLLAIITSDGKIRVLDITHPPSTNKSPPQYLHIKTSAFESRPPNTTCTCLTWLSPTHLAAGCANGYIAVWDLSAHTSQTPQPPTAPTIDSLPIFYQPVHITYITSLTSCRPSRPHLLISSSPSGHHRLTSLHNPLIDSVSSGRSRVLSSNILWHDQSQHALSCDDTYTLRAFNLRSFFQSVLLAHEEAEVRTLAASPVHPALLIGYADGGIGVYNPLRRLLHRRKRQQHYRHFWWRHEWRRGRPLSSTTTGTELDFPNGLSRLATSFAVAPINHTFASNSTSRKPNPRSGAGGTIFTTIYEEKSGVKCAGWNPNIEVGGWAAVGWGTGLVAVEDLCWN